MGARSFAARFSEVRHRAVSARGAGGARASAWTAGAEPIWGAVRAGAKPPPIATMTRAAAITRARTTWISVRVAGARRRAGASGAEITCHPCLTADRVALTREAH